MILVFNRSWSRAGLCLIKPALDVFVLDSNAILLVDGSKKSGENDHRFHLL